MDQHLLSDVFPGKGIPFIQSANGAVVMDGGRSEAACGSWHLLSGRALKQSPPHVQGLTSAQSSPAGREGVLEITQAAVALEGPCPGIRSLTISEASLMLFYHTCL